MKNILMGAVLCTALSSLAMDRDTPNAPSPEPTEAPQEFKGQFKQWIDSADLNAFQEFLKEHYGTAEQYISNEIIEYARERRVQAASQNLNEIIFLLNALNYGRQENMGNMEKIWHHTAFDQNVEKPDVPNPASPTPEETEKTNPFKENFFQRRSLLNIILSDFIEQQNVAEIVDILSTLTKNNDCDLHDIISGKTVRVAANKCEQEQTAVSALIYDLIKADELSLHESYSSDTTAQALKQIISKCRVSKLSKPAQDKSVKSAFATLIENNNLEDLLSLLGMIGEEEARQFVSVELLQAAQDMRDKLGKNKLYLFFDEEEGKQRLMNARKICETLSRTLCQSASNSTESDEAELKDYTKSLDTRGKYTLDMILAEESPTDRTVDDKASILNAILSNHLRAGNFERIQDIVYKLNDNSEVDLYDLIGATVVTETTNLRKSARRHKENCNYRVIKKTQLLLDLNSEVWCEEFSSDEEDPEGALDALESNQVKERIQTAFDQSTLESIVGQPKANIVTQILAQQKQAKDRSFRGMALV